MSSVVDLMKENEIELEWLFTMAKLDNHEGLMYFEPITETVDEVEVMNLEPRCFIIDGAKFVYDEELDEKIIVNAVDKVVTFTRIDGIQLNINTNDIEGFPFNVQEFKDVPFEYRGNEQPPEGFVEVS